MSLKDTWNALLGKTDATELQNETALTETASDAFPVVKVSEDQLSAYKQISLSSLAALGAAFSQLPESARTTVQSVTRTIATDETLFIGINPKGVQGFLRANEYGTVGNIMQVNPQGKQVIAGRMRFKAVNELPVQETTSVVAPIDPTLMVAAIALLSIEQKLDGIQKSVETVLQFLKQDKQSKQRGNLNMLAEIMEDYKLHCQSETFRTSRLGEVLSIKTAAYQDIDFYQNQIAAELHKQKRIHGSKDSQTIASAVSYQFAEYQLACHLYASSSFLDILLQRNFDTAAIENAANKMTAIAERYDSLYADCHAQIADYQRSSIEAQVIGGIGAAAKGFGKAIAAVPVIREGPVDEALISAGDSIGKLNRNTVQQKLQVFETFKDNRMKPFIENLQSVERIYNTENALLTDGTSLYMLQPV